MSLKKRAELAKAFSAKSCPMARGEPHAPVDKLRLNVNELLDGVKTQR